MSRQFQVNSSLFDWQVAPAEYEMANYDEPMIKYRRSVEDFIGPLSKKSLRKKTFMTISTNVLCAEIKSSKDTIDPVDRDIYLPLEIVLTKWSVSAASEDDLPKQLTTRIWHIYPGPPPIGCNCYAVDHKKKHKIEYDDIKVNNPFFERDHQKVMKEINSFLLADRVVFSIRLRNCRQDLGSLKWLNRETGYKTKPIRVFSLEDLYVVLIRQLNPESKTQISQGFARFRMEYSSDRYDIKKQCAYHQNLVEEDSDNCCDCCAKSLAQAWTLVLLQDVHDFTDISEPVSAQPTVGY